MVVPQQPLIIQELLAIGLRIDFSNRGAIIDTYHNLRQTYSHDTALQHIFNLFFGDHFGV